MDLTLNPESLREVLAAGSCSAPMTALRDCKAANVDLLLKRPLGCAYYGLRTRTSAPASSVIHTLLPATIPNFTGKDFVRPTTREEQRLPHPQRNPKSPSFSTLSRHSQMSQVPISVAHNSQTQLAYPLVRSTNLGPPRYGRFLELLNANLVA